MSGSVHFEGGREGGEGRRGEGRGGGSTKAHLCEVSHKQLPPSLPARVQRVQDVVSGEELQGVVGREGGGGGWVGGGDR